MRRDCPQRQGSQGIGTAQSQLAVEQERVQFIPPHPSTGERNQFQFRGAIRAPSVAQVGQRSQRVGRGQVQDSQAGTSVRHSFPSSVQILIFPLFETSNFPSSFRSEGKGKESTEVSLHQLFTCINRSIW